MPKPSDRPGTRQRGSSPKDRIRVPRELDSRGERELNQPGRSRQPGQSGKTGSKRSGSNRARLPRS